MRSSAPPTASIHSRSRVPCSSIPQSSSAPSSAGPSPAGATSSRPSSSFAPESSRRTSSSSNCRIMWRRCTEPYKVPREIEFVAELPKTASGKIRRVEFREREGTGRASTPDTVAVLTRLLPGRGRPRSWRSRRRRRLPTQPRAPRKRAGAKRPRPAAKLQRLQPSRKPAARRRHGRPRRRRPPRSRLLPAPSGEPTSNAAPPKHSPQSRTRREEERGRSRR